VVLLRAEPAGQGLSERRRKLARAVGELQALEAFLHVWMVVRELDEEVREG